MKQDHHPKRDTLRNHPKWNREQNHPSMKHYQNLFYHGYIRGRHTAIENLYRGFPGHLRGDAEKAAERLLKGGWLVRKKTGYGLQVSINPQTLPALKKELGVE